MPKPKQKRYKRYTLNVHWKHNLQIACDFAALVAELVADLKQLGEPFNSWHYYNTSDRRFPLPSDVNELCKKVLTPGFESIRGIKPEWDLPRGCSALLFSGGGGGTHVTLNIHLGQTSGSCYLTFPSKGEIATQSLTTERIQQVLKVLVQARNPEEASITDYGGFDGGSPKTDIPVCWLIYTADHWRQMPRSLEPFKVHRIEGYGNYVFTTSEPFDPDQENHRALAHQVKAMLIDAKVLVSRSS
jgi:Immunity protein 52